MILCYLLSSSVLFVTIATGPHPTLVDAQMVTVYGVFGYRFGSVLVVLSGPKTAIFSVPFPTTLNC